MRWKLCLPEQIIQFAKYPDVDSLRLVPLYWSPVHIKQTPAVTWSGKTSHRSGAVGEKGIYLPLLWKTAERGEALKRATQCATDCLLGWSVSDSNLSRTQRSLLALWSVSSFLFSIQLRAVFLARITPVKEWGHQMQTPCQIGQKIFGERLLQPHSKNHAGDTRRNGGKDSDG